MPFSGQNRLFFSLKSGLFQHRVTVIRICAMTVVRLPINVLLSKGYAISLTTLYNLSKKDLSPRVRLQ